MKKLLILLSVSLTVLLFGGAVLGGFLLAEYREDAERAVPGEIYDIIVDDVIKVYVGQTNVIRPYLISNDGRVETARFDYASSNPHVKVSYDGTVTLEEVPQGEVYVTISERNTGVSKRVRLHIIESLESVLGLIAPNGNLIEGKQPLKLGGTYAITVITEPGGCSIEPYCSVLTTDAAGKEKKVFEITYDGDKVLLTVLGLGEGTITIRVRNDANEEIHHSVIPFTLSTTDPQLTEIILHETGKTLLSDEELRKVSSLVIDPSVLDIASLSILPNLKTLFLDASSVMELANLSDSLVYRVPEALFYDYYASEAWEGHEGALMPYGENFSGSYIVYHSEKTTEVFYESLHSAYELIRYDAVGYLNTGWNDPSGKAITDEQLRTLDAGGIHAYAVWEPIRYRVVYHIREISDGESDLLTYDVAAPLRDAIAVSPSAVREGYRFAGWTDNSGASIYSSNVKYVKGEQYVNLSSQNHATVHLYDLWEPIEYTVIFDTDSETAPIEELTVQYGKPYTLPVASRPGYIFLGWRASESLTLDAGINETVLSSRDGAEVVLEPLFEQIEYTVILRLNGANAPFDQTVTEGAAVTLKYTEQFTLPILAKPGYTNYSWLCEENGKAYGATDTLYKEFSTACTVELRAIWTAAVYTIHYDCKGGSYGGSTTITANRFWNDGLSLLVPSLRGHSFVGWKNTETGDVYTQTDAVWSGNLISSVEENKKVFTLEAVYTPNNYVVNLNANGGNLSVSQTTVTFDAAYGTLPIPTRRGYDFKGWYLDGNKIISSTRVTTAEGHTLRAEWVAKKYTLSFDSAGGSECDPMTVTFHGTYGTLPTPTRGDVAGDGGYTSYTFAGWYFGETKIEADTTVNEAAHHTLVAHWTSQWNNTPKCFAEGTRVMLADGSEKPIEELSLGDIVMTWSFFDGAYQPMPIAFIECHGVLPVPVLELHFSDGTVLRIVYEHGIFDVTENRFVTIDSENHADYIGHTFLKTNGEAHAYVTLCEVSITTETVGVYTLLTACNYNAIAEGMLTITPEDIPGVFSVFEVGEGMRYDSAQIAADSERYGLYTYEEWADYLTYEEFVAFNGQYFKILVGRGTITEADILWLIDYVRRNQLP